MKVYLEGYYNKNDDKNQKIMVGDSSVYDAEDWAQRLNADREMRILQEKSDYDLHRDGCFCMVMKHVEE